jgi:hypothetical protein
LAKIDRQGKIFIIGLLKALNILMLTRLTIEHLPLFLELKKNNPGQWKLGEKFFPQWRNEVFYRSTLIAENTYTLGWIENGSLLSVTSLLEYSNNPSWCWLYYGARKQSYTNFQKVGGNIIINEMFAEARRRNLLSCIMLVRDNFPTITSEAIGKMKDKITEWHNLMPEILKYNWVDELKIPAGTESRYEYIRTLMWNRSWPVDLRVRLGYLKPEYRKI